MRSLHALLPILAVALSAAAQPQSTPVEPAAPVEQSTADPAPVASAPADEITEAPAEPAIALETNDPEIAARLGGLFAELSGLENVRATVKSGVVTLTGTTLTAEERKKAENIAGRLAGVVSVDNEIGVETNVGKRLMPLVARAQEVTRQVIDFLPILTVAIAALAAMWIIGVIFTKSDAIFSRIAPNPLVRTLFGQIVRLAFIAIGVVMAMRIMGATTLLGSVLGAAGVIGLAVGFAIRDTIENYIASILLSIRRPFAPNDLVIIEGHEGRVTRLNSRATFLTTLGGNEVRIPNAIVYKAKIENFTANPERRFEFKVGIGYENDLCEAIATAYQAVLDTEGVLADPEPNVLVEAFSDSSISLSVRGWVDQRQADFLKVKSAGLRSVKQAFEDNGISIPEPIQNIRFLSGESKPNPSAARPGRARKPSKESNEAVVDTAPDRTIESKVNALRSGAEEDLLTRAAPRE